MNTEQLKASEIYQELKSANGMPPAKKRKSSENGFTGEELQKTLVAQLPETLKALNDLRTATDSRSAVDMSLGKYVGQKYGFAVDAAESPDSFYKALGINPSDKTIQSLMSEKDFDSSFQWLVPEIIREAIRLGLRRNPIYPELLAGEESASMKEVTMPHINEPFTGLRYYDEAQTIERGNMSFGQRTVKVRKIGTGLNISDENVQYVKLNLLSLYLQQTGVSIDRGLTALAIDTLINGDNSQTVMSAPVIGVKDTNNNITYRDIQHIWIRMGRLGRLPQIMLAGENQTLEVANLPEFKGYSGETKRENIAFRTPMPSSQNFFTHSKMSSDDQLGILDRTAGLIKLNVQPMRVESERIVSRQLSGTTVTMTTGFAKLFRDAFVILDGSLAYSSNGFPTWMNPNEIEQQLFS